MGILAGIRHWFDKRSSVLTVAETTLEQMSKFNALVRSDPEDIIRAIDEFNCGYLAPMARLIGDYEQRDDKMRVSSIKMASAVSRCGWSVRPKKGFENDADAARQVEVLERFWSTVRVTNAFKRNERGGLALLKEQMMSAQSYGFAVHDLSWKPLANGEIEATFTHVPLWKFENRTGELRYIPQVGGWDGVEMKRGEWMVSTGDGIGIAAAICACMKRLGLTNWLVFTDRCVLPLIHGKTGAAYGSEQWNNLQKALKNINRLARVVTDPSTDINAIQMDGGKQNPFGPLIDWCDRAIVTLYRGGDLGTISRPDAVGGLGQLDEVDALEQRSCVRITETLNEQVSAFVVDYVLNQALKAEIVIEPVSKPDVKQDMEIDDHLAKYGVKLSKTDALARYGRAEAAEEADALHPPANNEQGIVNRVGMPNEAPDAPKNHSLSTITSSLPAKTPLQNAANPLQNAPRKPDGQGDPSALPPSQIASKGPSARSAVIDAFVRQNSDAAKAVQAVVDNPSEGAFAQLLANLPALLPTDPALASVIADEMTKVYGEEFHHAEARGELANSGTSEGARKGWETRRRNGWTPEQLAENREKAASLAKEALSDRQSNRTEKFGQADGEEAADIKAAVGIDVTGFEHQMSSKDIRHADKRHGAQRTVGKKKLGERDPKQVPLSDEDFKRVPDLYNNYDRIEPGNPEENTGLPSVRYIKKFPDGMLYGVDVVVEKNRTLRYKTGWKKRI